MSRFITILKYVLTLSAGIALLWYLIHNLSPEGRANIIKGFTNADYFWIILTVIIALLEKVIRAYRWNLLLEPTHHKPPLKNTLTAIVIGYFANTFAPRMGEVARCYVLNKTDNVPVQNSFGTVVAERAVDTICLFLIIPFALLLEFKKISEILARAWEQIYSIISKAYWIGILVVSFLLISTILAYLLRDKWRKNAFFIKVEEFVRGLIQSVLSIGKLKKKSQFIVCTISIWVCYFFMTYLAFFALDATSELGLGAGLIVLVSGGLGMAAPVQAGMGAYHIMVAEVLKEVYFVSQDWALPYAFLVWGSQTVTFVVLGIIALLYIFILDKKKSLNLHNVNL